MKTSIVFLSAVLLSTAGFSAYGDGQRYVRNGEPGSENGRSAASERYVYGAGGGSAGGGFSWSPTSSDDTSTDSAANPTAPSPSTGGPYNVADGNPTSSSPSPTPSGDNPPPSTAAPAAEEKNRTSFFEKLHGRKLNEQESFAALGAVMNDPVLLTAVTTDPMLWREFSDSLDPKVRETLSDIPGIGQAIDALDDRSDRLPLPSVDSLPGLGKFKPF